MTFLPAAFGSVLLIQTGAHLKCLVLTRQKLKSENKPNEIIETVIHAQPICPCNTRPTISLTASESASLSYMRTAFGHADMKSKSTTSTILKIDKLNAPGIAASLFAKVGTLLALLLNLEASLAQRVHEVRL